jgi:hypothetical protein
MCNLKLKTGPISHEVAYNIKSVIDKNSEILELVSQVYGLWDRVTNLRHYTQQLCKHDPMYVVNVRTDDKSVATQRYCRMCGLTELISDLKDLNDGAYTYCPVVNESFVKDWRCGLGMFPRRNDEVTGFLNMVVAQCEGNEIQQTCQENSQSGDGVS